MQYRTFFSLGSFRLTATHLVGRRVMIRRITGDGTRKKSWGMFEPSFYNFTCAECGTDEERVELGKRNEGCTMFKTYGIRERGSNK